MKKIYTGLLVGAIAGVLDVTPMIIMGLTWDANISAFVACIIGGFLIATSALKLPSVLKGLLIFFLLALPVMILVAFGNIYELIPMVVTNLIIGAFMGFMIGKFGRQ